MMQIIISVDHVKQGCQWISSKTIYNLNSKQS